MRPLHLLTLLFACFAFTALAQDPFRPGYIKLKNGEQQRGLVGKVIPGFPEKIEYKEKESDAVSTFRADEVEGYGITDGTFYSAFQTPGTKAEWIFVEILVQGDITLIQRNTFFFVLKKGEVNVIHLDEDYKSKLKKIMANCPYVAVQSGAVERTRDGLIKHVSAYNECAPQGKPNLSSMPRVVSFGLMVGYDNSTSSFSNHDYANTQFLTGGKLRDRSYPQFGIDITFKSYKVANYVGLYVGALYNSTSYKESNQRRYTVQNSNYPFTPIQRTEYNYYTIDFTEIKFPIGLEFMGPTRKRFSTHGRLGVIFSKQLTFKSTRPVYYFEDNKDGNFYEGNALPLTQFKPRTLVSGSLGADYRATDKSRVRIQFIYNVGGVKAIVDNDTILGDIKGWYTSFSIMGGYIF